MRATLSGYYRNLQFDQTKTAKELFDVTKQISSGQKIQYAHEDTSTFIGTMRLDNEVTTLTQVKQNAQKALQFSTNTDTTMNEMTKLLDVMKTKLIAAASESNSPGSLKAIAAELRALENNMFQLANTSIDGKYLFSGSATTTKAIDENGVYQGNAEDMKAMLGSGINQKFNVNGADLFLGDENATRRKISTNIPQLNQRLLHSDIMNGVDMPARNEYIKGSDALRDLMGDSDSEVDDINTKHNFYIRGTGHDGTSFKSIIRLKDTDTVDSLMKKIGEAYGNTPGNSIVNVTINNHGQFEIEDKINGSSKLDFHMTASSSIAYEPGILATGIGGTSEFTFPTIFDTSTPPVRIAPPLKTDDQIYINGEVFTVASVVDNNPLETVTVNEVITNSFTDVQVLKTTGLDVNDDLAGNYEFNRHGVPIKDFSNSNYTQYTQAMNLEQDMFNQNKFTLSGDFITKEGAIAGQYTLLTDVFASELKSIEFTGVDTDGAALVAPSFFDITANKTVNDLLKEIYAAFDPNDSGVLSVGFSDGKIQIGKRDTFDFTATQPALLGTDIVNLAQFNQNYTPINGDKIYFEGDPKPYTILDASGFPQVQLSENLNQSVASNAKVTLSTFRNNDVDIQLEAYGITGGAAAAAIAVPPLGVIKGLPSDSGVTYDEARFMQDNNKLIGDVSQIVKHGVTDSDGNDISNQFAVDKTKLVDVAGINSFGLSGAENTLSFTGANIDGKPFEVTINLKNDETTVTQSNPPLTDFQAKAYFSVTDSSVNPPVTTEYPIFDANFTDNNINGQFDSGIDAEVLTAGDKMTYKQLNDIINMIVTKQLPQDADATNAIDFNEYVTAIKTSQNYASTSLDEKGRIVFEQKNVASTQASITLADTNASDFSAPASVLSFNTNNTVTVSDPKTDFFAQLNAVISSVEAGRIRADGTQDDPRNIGIQNSLTVLDDLSEHMFSQHAIAGTQSQTLQRTTDRTDMLIITTQTLRSETIDVDFAQASLELKQLELNYQAMLSTVSRISQLSLINYL